MVDFKKLDEYIEDADYNIVTALATALDTNMEHAKTLYTNLEFEQERQLIDLLSDKTMPKEQRMIHISNLFDDEDMWEMDVFNGVDLADGYNHKCILTDAASRDMYMDWLEENGYDYLINTGGHFAVKCPDRQKTYRAQVAADGCKKKIWLKPESERSVEPSEHKKSLPQIKGDKAKFIMDDKIDEAKQTKKQKKAKDIKRAKEAGKANAGGSNPAKELEKGQYRNQVVPSGKKPSKKKERQDAKKIDVNEGVTGMNTMPALGRLRELSGLDPIDEHFDENFDEAFDAFEMEMNEGPKARLTDPERAELKKNLNVILYKLELWVDRAPEELNRLKAGIDWFEKLIRDVENGNV